VAGPLKTLYGALAASTFMTGVSLVYGEEEIHSTSHVLPVVAMVPMGGQYEQGPGYSHDLDYTIEAQWAVDQVVDLYLWTKDTNPLATPIDHADAIETLRGRVLSALQDQRAQYTDVASVDHGLYFRALSERWVQMQGGYTRDGRALVISVLVPTPVAMPAPQVATITSELTTVTVTPGAPT
jgi:hypothetical protein